MTKEELIIHQRATAQALVCRLPTPLNVPNASTILVLPTITRKFEVPALNKSPQSSPSSPTTSIKSSSPTSSSATSSTSSLAATILPPLASLSVNCCENSSGRLPFWKHKSSSIDHHIDHRHKDNHHISHHHIGHQNYRHIDHCHHISHHHIDHKDHHIDYKDHHKEYSNPKFHMSAHQHNHHHGVHHDPSPYPQHSQPYDAAPVRLPASYMAQGPYSQMPSLSSDHNTPHHHHQEQHQYVYPSSSHFDAYRSGPAPMPPSPQGPLPSMRSLNLQTQPPQQHMMMPIVGSPMSPPASSMPFSSSMPAYLGMGMPLSHAYGPGIFRGPAKKEIKRRTKTGCMTCRKRRIKCDESRPHCDNCRKSKRDCLGYEHVVRPNPPNSLGQPPFPNLHHHSSQGSTPLISPTSPDGAVGSPFMGGGGYACSPAESGLGYDETATSSPAVKSEPFDYAPIDPALQTPGMAHAHSHSHSHSLHGHGHGHGHHHSHYSHQHHHSSSSSYFPPHTAVQRGHDFQGIRE